MDALVFEVALVKAVAWPATAVFALVTFRAPLTELLGRIREADVSATGVVLQFRSGLDAAEARLAGGSDPGLARVRAVAEVPPVERIDAAWNRLQAALGTAAPPPELASLVAALRVLRDQVVAQRPAGLTAGDAARFERIVADVIARLPAA